MSRSDKCIATAIAGAICLAMVIYTHGEHGIGWFIFSLLVIWWEEAEG